MGPPRNKARAVKIEEYAEEFETSVGCQHRNAVQLTATSWASWAIQQLCSGPVAA